MNIEIAIIADDFTGAGDASMNFCQAGYSVYLPLPLKNESLPFDTGVLAINTESRLLAADEAYRKVAGIADECRAAGVKSYYKKIDSTLRGNIASELKALMDRAGYKAAIICPAAPDVGRTVIAGQCLIHNRPISQTESGRDHLNPLGSPFIKDLFPSVHPDRIQPLSLSDLEDGPESLSIKIDKHLNAGVSHIICDAVSHEHLESLASFFGDERLLFVGSAGLAKAISSVNHSGSDASISERNPLFPEGQTLVLSGSKMELSRRQINRLSEERGFRIVRIPVEAVLNRDRAVLNAFRESLDGLDPDQPLAIIPGDHAVSELPEDVMSNSEIIADFLAELTAEICRKRDIAVLVCIGGHTANRTMKTLNAEGVVYQGEAIPGTPYGKLLRGRGEEPLSLVTKSGSFGDENALISIVDFIKNRKGREKKMSENTAPHKIIIGISMGDPAGIGPEIIVKALERDSIRNICCPVVVGDARVIRQAAGFLGSGIPVQSISSAAEADPDVKKIYVYDLANADPAEFELGCVSPIGGTAAYEAVDKVIDLALKKEIAATVTAPINKEAINKAGFRYSGHTEIYAAKTGTKDYAMMLAHEDFRVIHVSTHVSLREACDRVKKDRIVKVIGLACENLKKMGIENPRIAVAALNPHAGENGLFGREEIEEISPAVEEAKGRGIDATGPYPPDTIFSMAAGGLFDIVVVMYHDQGHIPLKMAGFKYDRKEGKWLDVSGVNITLGLPIIRSSVDHGTAFDQAGKGTASDASMVNAIEYAVMLGGD